MGIAADLFLSAVLFVQLILCMVTLHGIQKRRRAVREICQDSIYFDACRTLFTLYRRIRHDFANYVQAAQMVPDEESRMQLKTQKKEIKKLIGQWTEEKEAFCKMRKEQTWNGGS